jgi:hypothetical protein
MKKSKKGLGVNWRLELMGAKVSELRDMAVKREERKREGVSTREGRCV